MKGRELLVGVTGGIAAFKTAALVSTLVQQGAGVSVVMTRESLNFIGAATFQALTGRQVHIDMFDMSQCPLGPHIELALRAELMCVAPATANYLAKTAHGQADDLLSTLYLTNTAPILMAPAMNAEMWAKASVQRNVQQLRSDGVEMIDPEEGWLSCRKSGAGRMASPETIAAAIAAHFDTEV